MPTAYTAATVSVLLLVGPVLLVFRRHIRVGGAGISVYLAQRRRGS